jgi:predicted transcriptional regulator
VVIRLAMQQLTIRVSDEIADEIEQMADEQETSKSEITRELLERGSDYERLETECDRLRREKRQILSQRDENRQLVEYVERERENERQRREANALQRAKYWFFGYSADETQG